MEAPRDAPAERAPRRGCSRRTQTPDQRAPRLVEPTEPARPELEDPERSAKPDDLDQHRDAVAGDHEAVREAEQAEVGIVGVFGCPAIESRGGRQTRAQG